MTALRLLPAPPAGPPYDDEVGQPSPPRATDHRVVGVQGALALAFPLPSGVPAVPEPPARLRVVGRGLVPQVGGPTDAAGRPDVARWAAMVAQAAMEVVAGVRPLTQLTRWTTPEVYEQLQWRRQPRPPRLSPSSTRALVSSVHVCQPAPDVAEACATVRLGVRAQAVALRLEGERNAWRCTALAL